MVLRQQRNLFTKLRQTSRLQAAYIAVHKKCSQGHDTPGLDGVEFADIESVGRDIYIEGLQEMLYVQKYIPWPLRCIEIPKPSGGIRRLAIPTFQDRILQKAALDLLIPIFDPALLNSSIGFRPGRDGQFRMLDGIDTAVRFGRVWVAQTDIASAFDTVPHAALMEKLYKKINDDFL